VKPMEQDVLLRSSCSAAAEDRSFWVMTRSDSGRRAARMEARKAALRMKDPLSAYLLASSAM